MNEADAPSPTMGRTSSFVSIVIPVCDAASFLQGALVELDHAASQRFQYYEIVLVDDLSTDRTVDIILEAQKVLKNLQLYCLSRRSGIELAFVAGLDHCIGDIVITLNLESDPVPLVERLWEASRSGEVEFVCGTGTGRKGPLFRLFRSAFRQTTGIELPIGMTWARLMSRRVANFVVQNNDRHLLLSVLPFFASHGVEVVPYELHTRRQKGGGSGFRRSGLAGSISRGTTILLASSAKPLRILSVLSVAASALSLAYTGYVVLVALLKSQIVEGWISLALPMAAMFFLISTMLGILSEHIYTLSQSSRNRLLYSIKREERSSVLEIQQRLNVMDETGRSANRGELRT
jgi:polyisoprenyl-phosphate glycosyltransferase